SRFVFHSFCTFISQLAFTIPILIFHSLLVSRFASKQSVSPKSKKSRGSHSNRS
ncbi:unnamed protein product, partial [Linum tenue]